VKKLTLYTDMYLTSFSVNVASKEGKPMMSSLADMQAWHGCGGAIKSTVNGSKS
jgi:hypothetical protein